ncbi:MAG: hypothetical protein M3497_01680 [Gemmatimonadota bacterium]|nr:hypothetical protein [Gemmatimonadota bacterium]
MTPDEQPRRWPQYWPALASEILLMIVIATAVWWFMGSYRERREQGLGWFHCATAAR